MHEQKHAHTYAHTYTRIHQVTATFLTNLDVHWPTILSTIMAGLSVFNVDVFRLPFSACAFSGLTHFSRLVTSTVFPLVVMALLALPTALRVCIRSVAQLQAFDEKGQDLIDSLFFSTLSLLFLVYPMVSSCSDCAFLNTPEIPKPNLYPRTLNLDSKLKPDPEP